mgnify:FL=1
MSELLIKFNQLEPLQKQELLDFLDFLLTKSKKKKPDLSNYKKQLLEISVWSEEDLAIFEENKNRFNEWQPTEW